MADSISKDKALRLIILTLGKLSEADRATVVAALAVLHPQAAE